MEGVFLRIFHQKNLIEYLLGAEAIDGGAVP